MLSKSQYRPGSQLRNGGGIAVCAAVACAFILGFSAPGHARSQDNFPPELKAQLDSLARPQFDAALCGSIASPVVLHREGGMFSLDSGSVIFFSPVQGRVTGAMFFGRARFEVTPPTHLERQQLQRFTGDTIRSWALTELYFRFTDFTFDHIMPRLQLRDGEEVKIPARPPDSYAQRVEDELLYSLGSRLLMDVYNGIEDGLFYAAVDPMDDTRYHFLIDPLSDEPVKLFRRPASAGKHGIDLVCSWPRSQDIAAAGGIPAEICHDQITSRHHILRTMLNEPGPTAVIATLDFVPRSRNLRAVRFDLAAKLEIDSITSPRGVVYYHYDDPEIPLNYGALFPMAGSGGGWGTLDVFWKEPLPEDSASQVSFSYNGKYLLYEFPWGDFYINEATTWYPTHDWRTRTTYDMSFDFSAAREVIAAGNKLDEAVSGDRKQSRWRMEYPVAYVSFNYGYFEQLEMPPQPGLPRVEIYRGKNHQGSLFSRDMKKRVGDDIIGALKLFTESYGPLPFDHLAVTEIPGGHGQGFAQLLHLSWYSFQEEREGKTELFRAHEVAHQWWGHLVGWKTYHDQWLSEGFAEFSGAWFVERKFGFGKQVRGILADWKKEILQRGGNYGWHAGPQVAPIWMGGRSSSYDSPGSYAALIYDKGAYVLYMLRRMLFDYRDGSDRRFVELMTDYVQRYRDSCAATADFQRVVEDHVGGSMDWFFNQWVYGTQIPKLVYSSTISTTADGEFIVSGKVVQSEVKGPFRLFMPITFVFGKDRKSTFLQEINGWVTEFVSPPLPLKPVEVIFNDYQTILCRE